MGCVLLCMVAVSSAAIVPARDGSAAEQQALFTDIGASSGLDFVHVNGMSGKFYFPEMTGQGGALLDYDNDGDMDLYLVQGGILGSQESRNGASATPAADGSGANSGDRLYRNDLRSGRSGETVVEFVDVTQRSGIRATDYGMGVAVGDYNNDGWIDVYVTNFGTNRLLKNNGDGSFSEVSESAGVNDALWGTSAAFFDYDRDGWLDLYVANYVDFALAANKVCYAPSTRRDYCGPSGFSAQPDRLYRNQRDGTFRDVTEAALKGYTARPGLGVVSADFNGDGWIDIYVANDGEANQLWINQRDGTFIDDALFSGAAVNRDGRPEASMGVDAGDFDADGDEDLFMTHLAGETNTLYVNDGKALFADQTQEFGLAAVSAPYTAFGTAWLDFDDDGWLDLIVLNGAVTVQEPQARAGDPYPLHQPNQLFRNDKGRGFIDLTAAAGSAFMQSEVSRGAAVGDIDNDGDPDIVVFNNNGPVRLLRNDIGAVAPWLGLRLVSGQYGGRDALGARVALERVGAPTLWRRVRTDGSYCSANDPRVIFGLADGRDLRALTIYWPDGSRARWDRPIAGRYTTLEQHGAELTELE